MKSIASLLCVMLLLGVLSGGVVAQEATPTVGLSKPVLPNASALGADWVELGTANNNRFDHAFTAYERHAYGGLHGSIVIIEVMPFRANPQLDANPWLVAGNLFRANHQFYAEPRLANEEPEWLGGVDGCTIVERFDDPVSNYWQPLAITLCGYGNGPAPAFVAGAVEVMVFGSINGMEGRQVSDAIASLVAGMQEGA